MATILPNLTNKIPAAREVDIWHDTRHDVFTYLTGELPPLDLVTSVRAR